MAARNKAFYENLVDDGGSGSFLDTQGVRFLRGVIQSYNLTNLLQWRGAVGFDDPETVARDAVVLSYIASSRELALSFRGTVPEGDVWQWLFNRGNLYCKFEEWNELGPGVKLHQGFASSYRDLKEALLRAIRAETSNPSRIRISGHSRGGALAQVAGADLAVEFPQTQIEVVTFASPRVGNQSFKTWCLRKPNFVIASFTNARDPVSLLPPTETTGALKFLADRSLPDDVMQALREGFVHVMDPVVLDSAFNARALDEEVVRDLASKQCAPDASLSSLLCTSLADHDVTKYWENYELFFKSVAVVRSVRNLRFVESLDPRCLMAEPALTGKDVQRVSDEICKQNRQTQSMVRSGFECAARSLAELSGNISDLTMGLKNTRLAQTARDIEQVHNAANNLAIRADWGDDIEKDIREIMDKAIPLR